MKWTEQNVHKLRELCREGKTNAEIANIMRCKLTDVYAKRSQLGITIAKCKGIEQNPEFEKALKPVKAKGMRKDVREAFGALYQKLLLAMGSDRTSIEDAERYKNLADTIGILEDSYNARIGK